MILVDTVIWSLAFRRLKRGQEEPQQVQVLRRLIVEDEPIGVPGVVLQEVLSGIREGAQFDRLKTRMASFRLVLADQDDHVEAARILNECRKVGVAAGTVDALISAMAVNREAFLFTLDPDFKLIAEHSALKLFAPSAGALGR